jgi:hypothetical protein
MSRVSERSKKANELCNNPKNDCKSTEDLCYMSMEWADETMLERVCEHLKKLVYQEYPGCPSQRVISDEELAKLKEAVMK